MAYDKVREDWKDYPDTTTPVLAADIEHIEQGIFDAAADADEAQADANAAQASANTANADLATHAADATNVHGIVDTGLLETTTGAQTKVDTHSADTTNVHGIVDTTVLETTTGAQAKADAKVEDALVDGVTTKAPSQNKVFDELALKANLAGATFTGDIVVPAEAYGAGWNASNEVPTKNDVYDKMETVTGTAANAITRTGGGLDGYQDHSTTGATETIDLANGNVHRIVLDAACTLTFTGATTANGCTFTLIVDQDGTGSRLITWPASVDWAGGVAPTLSTGANDRDVLTFLTVDGGTRWMGFMAGADFS